MASRSRKGSRSGRRKGWRYQAVKQWESLFIDAYTARIVAAVLAAAAGAAILIVLFIWTVI
jgi:hypothetical protein